MVREAYQMLLAVISKVQAVARGRLVREGLSVHGKKRMNTYKKQIFYLWCRAHTPLSYRAKFWPLLKSAGLVRLAIAEQELARLWNELKIHPPSYPKNGGAGVGLRLGATLGVSDIHHWQVLKVRAVSVNDLTRADTDVLTLFVFYEL